MTDIPESAGLNRIGRRLIALEDDSRALRADMDMLIRIVVRLDNAMNPLREDVRALWASQRGLRRRIEAVEDRARQEQFGEPCSRVFRAFRHCHGRSLSSACRQGGFGFAAYSARISGNPACCSSLRTRASRSLMRTP